MNVSLCVEKKNKTTHTHTPLPSVLASISRELARTNKNLMSLNAGSRELQATASAQAGDHKNSQGVFCPQAIRTFVSYVSGLQAANGVFKTGNS